MENIRAIAIDNSKIFPHELAVVIEEKPDFLPNATMVQAEEKRAILYSVEDMLPLSHFGERQGEMSLSAIFTILTGYIRSLMEARNMLLNTAYISSDPEKGVFISTSETGVRIKVTWGFDTLTDNNEKICRIISELRKRERVMGAASSMERLMEIVRAGNPSLKNCLAAVERVNREWNRIERPAVN